MHLKVRNVNQAFYELVCGFQTGVIEPNGYRLPIRHTGSRNGNVLVLDEPIIITYANPLERCLFNQSRDVNPFSTLYEGLYMLTGRNDVAPLAYYTKKFAEYSDDGKTLNGSYGYRWRKAWEWEYGTWDNCYDQLQTIIQHLRKNPSSRRAVLSMWNVSDDLTKIDETKDCACNTSAMFSIRQEDERIYAGHGNIENDGPTEYLDMTVTNRSNDMILGALGANYVTFSVLLEYMAAQIGVEVGVYNQFSNNMHVYEWNWKPEEWLKADDEYDRHTGDPYEDDNWKPYPLVKNPEVFDKEVVEFVEENKQTVLEPYLRNRWTEPFLNKVAQPMMYAFHFHKAKDYTGAMFRANEIQARDWQIVCRNWLQRRVKSNVSK